MTCSDQIDDGIWKELNLALLPASGLSDEELLARINRMAMPELVQDVIKMMAAGSCQPANECIPDLRTII